MCKRCEDFAKAGYAKFQRACKGLVDPIPLDSKVNHTQMSKEDLLEKLQLALEELSICRAINKKLTTETVKTKSDKAARRLIEMVHCGN